MSNLQATAFDLWRVVPAGPGCLVIMSIVSNECHPDHAAQAAPISDLWMPENLVQVPITAAAGGGAPAAASVGYDDHKPRSPPPDLPSLLLDSRITYLGMPVGLWNELCPSRLLWLHWLTHTCITAFVESDR